MFSPATWHSLHDQGLLSPTGECRTFDAAANGYARGEAINMIYVKKLSYAIRDKDPVRAIIRGTCVNTDGRTQGMTTPSSASQAALIRQTYNMSGIKDMSQTAIFECHGTGTPVGDPLETAAVAACFGEKGVIISGVQSPATSSFEPLTHLLTSTGQTQRRACGRRSRYHECNQGCSLLRTSDGSAPNQLRKPQSEK